jgi:hypothetical protein
MYPSSAFRYAATLYFAHQHCHDPHSGVMTNSRRTITVRR